MNIQEPLGTNECPPFPTGLHMAWLNPKKEVSHCSCPKFGFGSPHAMSFLLSSKELLQNAKCSDRDLSPLTGLYFALGDLTKYRADAVGISDSRSLTETLFRTSVCSATNVITPSVLWHSLSENWDWLGGTWFAKNTDVGLLRPLDLKEPAPKCGDREIHFLGGACSVQLTAKPQPSFASLSHCSWRERVAPHNPWRSPVWSHLCTFVP